MGNRYEKMLIVKPGQGATAVGRKIEPHRKQKVGHQVFTRIQDICKKYRVAGASAKMYDQFGWK